MNRFLSPVRLFLLCGALALISNPGIAGMIGETSPSNISPAPSDGFTVGYEFITGATPLTVTALGVWDEGNPDSPGLSESHEIAIWAITGGTPLVDETIGPSSSGTQINAWLFVPLGTPILLANNTTHYVIGVYDGNGTDKYHGSVEEADPGDFPVFNTLNVTFFERRASTTTGSFVFPTGGGGPGAGSAWDMPNFEFITPEPASFSLLMLGCAAAITGRRRR